MRLLMTAHLGVIPTCAEARVRIPLKVAPLPNTNKPPNTQKGCNMWLNKRKLIAKIERMMIEEELELHGLDSQHSRAYHTGMIDGLGMALYAVSPIAAKRNPISIVWFDEDYDEPRKAEQDRETFFDATNTSLFESAEAK
jgi:hypothetical protein